MGTLRIHFTGTDLVRTRLADGADPLWEIVASLQMLRARYGGEPFTSWRRRVRDDLHRHNEAGPVRHLLFPLTPDAEYVPDFLTPPEGLLGLDAGVEAVLATPRQRLGRELRRIRLPRRTPPAIRRLAAGDRGTIAELGRALRAYFATALAPYWERLTAAVDVDRAERGLCQRTGGTEALLRGFSPMMRWRPPVLTVAYPVDAELDLRGRGLLLIPSYFCWHRPVTLADPSLPPTLVYPLHTRGDLLDGPPQMACAQALDRLLGATRARILLASSHGATTTELARRTGISSTTASQHTAVLRDAGLITSHRHGNSMVHMLSGLGADLLGRHHPAPGGTS